ncbi:MAG TPA: hypothetical protein DCE52_10710 [Rhodobacteraceae bacterium]|nr:hypothetical protein [Paracoccaceae bacterium]
MKQRLTNLDVLRGLAALAVCAFHFDLGGKLGVDVISSVTKFGYLGVDIFFVISGFVIPFAMERTNYRIKDAGYFLAARFFRLYPAYFAAAFLSVGLWFLSTKIPGFQGALPSFSFQEILANIFLLCDFQNEKWLIPVFWTLAIEAQYYLLIAASYGGLNCKKPIVSYLILSAWIVAPIFIGQGPTVFTWTALFAMGILCHMVKSKKIPNTAAVVFMSVAFFAHTVTKGWESGLVGILSAACILYLPNIPSRSLIWIGSISYSLYLLHIPLGVRVVTFSDRLHFSNYPLGWLVVGFCAFAFSIVSAAIFFNFIEMPSHRLSRKVGSIRDFKKKVLNGAESLNSD